AYQIDDRAILPFAVRLSAPEYAARVGAVENQPRYALRMAGGVRHARRSALRDAEEGDGLGDAGGVDDRLEIVGPSLEREVRRAPISHAASALVVAHVVEMIGEEAEPVVPHRTLPIELQMRQPVGRLDQRGPTARLGPREADAVGGDEVADGLPGHSSYSVRPDSIGSGQSSHRVRRSRAAM